MQNAESFIHRFINSDSDELVSNVTCLRDILLPEISLRNVDRFLVMVVPLR